MLLLAISAALMALAAKQPGFAEWYSENIYPLFVNSLGRLWGLFPFSVSEIALYILIVVFLLSLAAAVRKGIHGAVPWLSCILLAAGILAFLYTICCGINYHRKSFSEEEGIITYRYTAQDLKEVCLWLTEEVNTISGEVDRDSSRVMTLEAPEGEGAVEANYNGDMTAYNIPFTTCHELSHLRGFMQEEEANFIAFLACIQSDRTDFRYSGYLSGWVYCMNALYRTDHEAWQEVRLLLAEEAEPDLEANSAFWDAYEGRISEAADKINDTYLKANGQADGVQSYSRMVDLIVAYFG